MILASNRHNVLPGIAIGLPDILPCFRSVTGSGFNLDIEEKMFRSMLARVGENGLLLHERQNQ